MDRAAYIWFGAGLVLASLGSVVFYSDPLQAQVSIENKANSTSLPVHVEHTDKVDQSRPPANSPLVVSYFSRPPYYQTQSGVAGGLLVDRARDVLERTGLKYQFIEMSIERILNEVRFSRKPHCSVGWLKNSERDAFAQFSGPFFKNKPYVLLVRKSEESDFKKLETFEDVLKDKRKVLGIARGFSYGVFVDEAIKRLHPTLIDSEPLHHNLPMMLSRGRFSYMVVDEEEVSGLLKSAKLDESDFATIRLKDFPAREPRRLMCSKSTPVETMSKLNKALESEKI